MTLAEWAVLLVVAGICGSVARALAGGVRGGCLVSVALGFIGALFGAWLARLMGLPEPFVLKVGEQPFPIVWSIAGAAIFAALLGILGGNRGRPR